MKKFKFLSKWGPQIALIALAVLWLSLVAMKWAEAADEVRDPQVDRSPAAEGGVSSAPSADDEYNFTWLDPDKKIYVLQNRRYTKASRFLFSVMGGPGLSNPYRTVWNFDPRVTYYLSEAWGIEFFYRTSFNTPNTANQAISGSSQLQNIQPVIREIKNQYGASLLWIPWYAKINVFNKIVYFDWYFSAGAGDVHSSAAAAVGPSGSSTPNTQTFVDQDNFAAFLGTGHVYNLSQNWIIRLDMTAAFYNAPIFGTSSAGGSSWFSNIDVSAGIGLKL